MGVYLLTGATSGIGRATGELLLERGHRLVVVGRDRDRLAEAFPSARCLVADLARPESIEPALAALSAEAPLDRLDGLVHSAGVAHVAPFSEITPATWQRVLTVNTVAPAELTRLALPALRAARGHVVLINSGQGLSAAPGWSSYAASKFALRALADSLRAEESGHGVRVTTIYSGRTDTPMQRYVRQRERGDYQSDRYLRPRSVAAVVLTALESPPDAALPELTIRPSP